MITDSGSIQELPASRGEGAAEERAAITGVIFMSVCGNDARNIRMEQLFSSRHVVQRAQQLPS
jgi:hypothetical protein